MATRVYSALRRAGRIALCFAAALNCGCSHPNHSGDEKPKGTSLGGVENILSSADVLKSGKQRDEAIAETVSRLGKVDVERINQSIAELHAAIAALTAKISAVDVEALNRGIAETTALKQPVEQVLFETTEALKDVRGQVQRLPLQEASKTVSSIGEAAETVSQSRRDLQLPIMLFGVLLSVLILCACGMLYRIVRSGGARH